MLHHPFPPHPSLRAIPLPAGLLRRVAAGGLMPPSSGVLDPNGGGPGGSNGSGGSGGSGGGIGGAPVNPPPPGH